MPEYYAPPNPYGSYFAFDTGSIMLPANYAPNNFMSAGVSTLMGQPTAFNPTPAEMASQNLRNMTLHRYMADQMRTDPRVAGLSAAAQQFAFGSNEALRRATMDKLGGINGFNQALGSALNMSPLGSMMGGNYGDLAAGALQAVSSGNLNFGGMSANGDGLMQVNMARALMTRVKSQFFTRGGLPNLAASSGLNMEQLGGILATGAQQGAFSGLSMATINEKGKAVPNDATLAKMTDFTKQAAKAIGAIVDVFGPGPLADSLNRMQAITGLDMSRMGNMSAALGRFNNLKMVADRSGIGPAQIMQEAANVNQSMARMGFNYGIGDYVVGRATEAFNSQKSQLSNLVANPLNREQMIKMGEINAAGMSVDPVGAGLAGVIAMGQYRGLSGGKLITLGQQAQAAASEGGIGGLNAFFQKEFSGASLPGFIRSQGGSRGVFEKLNSDNKLMTQGLYSQDLDTRSWSMLTRNMTGALGQTRARNLTFLMKGMTGTGLDSLIESYSSGGADDALRKIIQGDIDPTESADAYMAALKTMDPQSFREQVGVGVNAKLQIPGLANYQRKLDVIKQTFTPTMVDLTGSRGAMIQGRIGMGLLSGFGKQGIQEVDAYAHMVKYGSKFIAKDLDLQSADPAKAQAGFRRLLEISKGDAAAMTSLSNFGLTEESVGNIDQVRGMQLKMGNALYAGLLKAPFSIFQEKDATSKPSWILSSKYNAQQDLAKMLRILDLGISTVPDIDPSLEQTQMKRILGDRRKIIDRQLQNKNVTPAELQSGMKGINQLMASPAMLIGFDAAKLGEMTALNKELGNQAVDKLNYWLRTNQFTNDVDRDKAKSRVSELNALGFGGDGTSAINGTLSFDPTDFGLKLKGFLATQKGN